MKIWAPSVAMRDGEHARGTGFKARQPRDPGGADQVTSSPVGKTAASTRPARATGSSSSMPGHASSPNNKPGYGSDAARAIRHLMCCFAKERQQASHSGRPIKKKFVRRKVRTELVQHLAGKGILTHCVKRTTKMFLTTHNPQPPCEHDGCSTPGGRRRPQNDAQTVWNGSDAAAGPWVCRGRQVAT